MWIVLAASAMATLAASCGGKAVIDGDAGDGGRGGVDGATSTGPTMPSVNVATVTTGMMPSLCAEACATLAMCDGPSAEPCTELCEAVPAGCRDIHQRWLSCSLGETNTMCGLGPGQVCGPDLEEFLACTGKVVGDVACGGGPDGCSCSVFVSPGVVLEQVCGVEGCRCEMGGQLMGTCVPPDPSCDVLGGCCAGIFFTGPP